jgi:hypothetical protein
LSGVAYIDVGEMLGDLRPRMPRLQPRRGLHAPASPGPTTPRRNVARASVAPARGGRLATYGPLYSRGVHVDRRPPHRKPSAAKRVPTNQTPGIAGRRSMLSPADVEAIAECLLERVRETLRPHLWIGLADVAEVAQRLRVHENWVYAHAEELGAIRLGGGEKARLRFDLERVACAIGVTESARRGRGPGRLPRHGLPAGVPLTEGRGR